MVFRIIMLYKINDLPGFLKATMLSVVEFQLIMEDIPTFWEKAEDTLHIIIRKKTMKSKNTLVTGTTTITQDKDHFSRTCFQRHQKHEDFYNFLFQMEDVTTNYLLMTKHLILYSFQSANKTMKNEKLLIH